MSTPLASEYRPLGPAAGLKRWMLRILLTVRALAPDSDSEATPHDLYVMF
jgi:hypothetical protein